MKVVLLKDLKGKGKKGDIINVSDGYAVNYLVPNGYAVVGNATNLNQAKQANAAQEYQAKLQKEHAEKMAESLKGVDIIIPIKCGQNGKIFGSVTNKEVAATLEKLGYEVDRKKIDFPNIKTLGQYTAKLKLHPQVSLEIAVNVVAEE